MPKTVIRDFQQIISKPVDAFAEGLRYFRGEGLMHDTLRQLAKDLDFHGIDYCVIGAVALNQHGYQRFTTDIDLLMTKEGLAQFTAELIGRGYRPGYPGATKKFRATAENVQIKIITAGEYPGDGKPKPIVFPHPAEFRVEINGIKTISLEKLVELKLASGLSGLDRLKDLADVQELIKAVRLDRSLADEIDASVRDEYLRLRSGVMEAEALRDAPDREHRFGQ